jgi:hypothetical protein
MALLEIARSLEPLIRGHEDELERARRLPDELVDALYDRGSTVIMPPHPPGASRRSRSRIVRSPVGDTTLGSTAAALMTHSQLAGAPGDHRRLA